MTDTLGEIKSDLNNALKSKDSFKAGTLRFVLAAVHNAEIAKGKGAELSEEELIEILQKQAKQRRESIEAYQKGDRSDLAEKEEKELGIIKAYLPQQLSEDEVREIVEGAIQEAGASGPQEMGRVMSLVMPKVKGRADGSLVSRLVKEKLSA
ncbi:MAG: GatB/YqeY domain-containing protein [Patescibacteria group bacterium]|nr:MAG: GatB/YqeY domain-containing protein [Patescibacteria group bacterium]